MRGSTALAALAALLLACCAAAQPAAPCAFTTQQPRYWQAATPLSTLHVDPRNSFFLGDSLLRTLTRQLGLQPCQVLLTAARPCSAALAAAPCPDPLWLCGGELTISASVYEAARSGLCAAVQVAAAPAPAASASAANATTGAQRHAPAPPPPPAVCQTLEQYPAIAELVAADACDPACFAQVTDSANSSARLAPPSPPRPAAAGACYTFTLQMDAASEAEAALLAANLHNATTAGALQDSLASFAAGGEQLQFILGDSEVETILGFGYFPPPSPPPSPPPPSPSPPPPSPPPPSPPPPLLPFLPDNSTTEGEDPSVSAQSMDGSGQIVYGEWGPCSAACGAGWQTRTASCLSTGGALLALAQCPDGPSAVTSRACVGPSCNGTYWQYSAWSACNVTCGAGTATRMATCQGPEGSICDPADKQATEQECNTAPCGAYAWQARDWGACGAECGGGSQSRPVACIDLQSGQPADEAQCAAAGAKPSAEQRCALQACDFCADNACYGHGECSDGACSCDPGTGFSGAHCQVPSGCASGLVDSQLQCCASGVVDTTGACCPAGSVLDAAGACCASGTLDACGVCGGSGKLVDITGACCDTLPDANGVCCQSGIVDECGVCDGLGNSCAVDLSLAFEVAPSLIQGDAVEERPLDALLANLTAALQLPEGSLSPDSLAEVPAPTSQLAVSSGARRLLVADKPQSGPVYLTASLTLDPDTASESEGAQFSAAWMDAVLSQLAGQSAGGSVRLVEGTSVQRSGVCDNGICEVGERSVEGLVEGSCPEDCAVESKACPAGCGAGVCLPASGTCQCFAGYNGTSCQDCAAGFVQSNGNCVADVVALGLAVPPATVPVTDSGAGAGNNATVSSTEDGGSGTNVGIIVGPIMGVLGAIALGIAVTFVYRRRRAFRSFSSAGNSPANSGDVESQYTTAAEDAALFAETRSLREKYGSASSLGRFASSQGGTNADAMHGLRQSQESLMRSSQEAFKHLRASDGPLAASMAAAQLAAGRAGSPPHPPRSPARQGAAAGQAPAASATPGLADTHPLRRSLTSSGNNSSGATSQNTGSSGRAIAATVDTASHLPADSPAIAAASMAVHPVQSVQASMLSTRSLPQRVDASLTTHLAGVMMQSYTSSPMDPQARLFYNPAYNTEPGMSESKSLISASHVPRPGYPVRMPLTARPNLGGASEAAESAHSVPDPAVRRLQSVNRSLDSLDTLARRDKLDRLRAAVEALEADAAAGALASGGRKVAGPGELQSPSTQVMANVRASVESVCWMGEEDGAPVSPLALSAGATTQSKFLDGRPEVPRLQLGRLHSTTQQAQQGAEEQAATEAEPEPAPAAPAARPAVPPLPLSKLNPAAAAGGSRQAAVQVARIPAAHFSAMDASTYRSGLATGREEAGPAPADPLDDLDSMLGSARKAQPSARELIAAGFSKLLAPLRSARKGGGEAEWARQMSTPRSWGASSGMQRTRAESNLQRSVDVEDLDDIGPSASQTMQGVSPAGGGAHSGLGYGAVSGPAESMATSATSSSIVSGPSGVAGRYLNTPRGRLLQTLAAEAAQAQKERSLRQACEAVPLPPSYSAVMGHVEAALQHQQQQQGNHQQCSASSSPRSRIPRAAPAPALMLRDGHGSAAQPQYRGASPSKIPRPAPLALPAQGRRQQYEDEGENMEYGSMPASPDKERPAGGGSAAARLGAAALVLRGSIENLPRYE
ncbi:hypothetical protein ABPG75_013895 [Micractinium tetrahymenae]